MIKKGTIAGLSLFMMTLGFAFLKTEREVRITDSIPHALILFDDGNSVCEWLRVKLLNT